MPAAAASLVPDTSLPDTAGSASARIRAAGDRLRQFFDAAADELLGTARHLTRQHHDAVEVFQETFLKCWQRLEQLHEVRNLRAFVFTVLVNTVRDEQRRKQRRPTVALELEVADGAGASPGSNSTATPVGAEIERSELVELVREAISQLRDEDREVFLLRQNGELAYAEIATLLGLPEGTVKTRMRKALIRLREVLDRHPATRSSP